MKKLIYSSAFILGVFTTSALAQQNPTHSLPAALDTVLAQAVDEQKIVGAVMLISQHGQVVYQRAIGYADREAQIPMQENSLFRLASMTKPIVSVAALSLVDQGKLALDAPITDWLPDFKPTLPTNLLTHSADQSADNSLAPIITVRQLLTHTAGLNYRFFEKPDGPYHQLGVTDGLEQVTFDQDENLKRIAAAPLLYVPGTQWHYSLATDVLGAVVAKAYGDSLSQAVNTTVTQPLHMHDTSFIVTDIARLTVPYADNGPHPVRMTDPYLLPFPLGSDIMFSPSRITDPNAYPVGGAGLAGTAADYMRFLEALRTGEQNILTSATLQQFKQNATGDLLIDVQGEGWGFGLGVSVLTDPQLAKRPMHRGTWSWSGVYGSLFFVDQQAGLSIVILTNTTMAGMVGEFPDALIQAIYQSDLITSAEL